MQFLTEGLPSADPAGLSQTVCQLCGKSFKYGQHTKSHVLNVHVTGGQLFVDFVKKY